LFPHPTFLFPQLKVKLKGHNFYTTQMNEAESQATLNTLAEHRLPACILKMAKALATMHA
jgi:hypothetical protein